MDQAKNSRESRSVLGNLTHQASKPFLSHNAAGNFCKSYCRFQKHRQGALKDALKRVGSIDIRAISITVPQN